MIFEWRDRSSVARPSKRQQVCFIKNLIFTAIHFRDSQCQFDTWRTLTRTSEVTAIQQQYKAASVLISTLRFEIFQNRSQMHDPLLFLLLAGTGNRKHSGRSNDFKRVFLLYRRILFDFCGSQLWKMHFSNYSNPDPSPDKPR